MMSVLRLFIDKLSDCLAKAYSSVKPNDGIGKLLNEVKDCLTSEISRYNQLREEVPIHDVNGKIFIQVDKNPYMPYNIVRELADIVIMIKRGEEKSLVFVQLKNAAANLDMIGSAGRDLEKIIGHFDPRTKNVMYANKGQLLILSGFFERVLYYQYYGEFEKICSNTFLACNELPIIRYRRRGGYPYGGGLNIPTNNARITERVNRTLTLYIFSVKLHNELRIIVSRSGDLLYVMARPGYVPFRLRTIEQNILNDLQNISISSTITDISSSMPYINTTEVRRKVRSIEIFMLNRPINQQLELNLRDFNLINFPKEIVAIVNYYGINTLLGQALIDLVGYMINSGKCGRVSNDCVIHWNLVHNRYIIEDLQVGNHISKDDYEVEIENAKYALAVEVRY